MVSATRSFHYTKSINKNTTPAYCLTEKGMEWKRKPDAQKNSNGTAVKKLASKKQPHKEQSKFQFHKKTAFHDLDKTFIAGGLHTSCIKIAGELKIMNPSAEYEKFILHNSAVGCAWFNWLSAFRNWCNNHHQLQKKSNSGDDGRGLYR